MLKPLRTKNQPKNRIKSPASAFILSVSLLVALSGAAKSATITLSAPLTFDGSNQAAPPDTTDYEGNFYDGTAAPYDVTIGTFDVSSLSGDTLIDGTISGTFGDVNYSTTALTDLYLDGIEVAECDSFSEDCAIEPDGVVSWTYTLDADDLNALNAALSSGSLDFTAVQNGFGAVVVGTPSLELDAATPEPASIFTLAGGLLAIAAWRRRK